MMALNVAMLIPVLFFIIASAILCSLGFRRRGYGRIGEAFVVGFTVLSISLAFGLANNMHPSYELNIIANVLRITGWGSIALGSLGIYLWFNGRAKDA